MRAWSAACVLGLLGCIAPRTHLTVIASARVAGGDGPLATPIPLPASPIASAAATKPVDAGNWFFRSVYQPDPEGTRKLYAVEIIYCPTEKSVFRECRVGMAWSRNGKGGLGPQVGAPPSPVSAAVHQEAAEERPPPERRQPTAPPEQAAKAGGAPVAVPTAQEVSEASRDERIAYALARRHRAWGEHEEEERLYKQCLKLQPKFALCHHGLFELFQQTGREKDATIACQNVLKFADPVALKPIVDSCNRFLAQ